MTHVSNSRPDNPAWQFWIDRGGTFTDVIAVSPAGCISAVKLLSEAPNHYTDAALEGIERLFSRLAKPGDGIGAVRIGTTVGTNALLERRGARTAFVTTAGLADVLAIGTQQRPALFDLAIRLPTPLYESVIEAVERIGADGGIVTALDEARLFDALTAAKARGIESVAIAFLHGYKHPRHERRAAEIAAAAGFTEIAVSHEVSARPKLVERGLTTVVDAYLSPAVRRYAASLRQRLAERDPAIALGFMQSNGGLIAADGFRGHNSILSGPAGGVVGMADSALRAGFPKAIGFDMGGTSTDVSLYAGNYERTESTDVAGMSIAVPTMRINTVAAGGGSILDFADGRLQVGPASAGADPGPACYGNGGPATLTDANVVLGRIQPDWFPRVFGPDGRGPLAANAAENAVDALTGRIPADAGLDATGVAAGALAIAVNHMAAAIEKVSIQRGHDPREFALACFGGAGGQHACLVADALDIATVLIDPLAGVLSAYGIGIADLRQIETAPIERSVDTAALTTARDVSRRLITRLDAGRSTGSPVYETRLLLRAGSSDSIVAVAFDAAIDVDAVTAAFDDAYRERFGFAPHTREIHLEAVEVEYVAKLPRPTLTPPARSTAPPRAVATRRAWIGGGWCNARVFERDALGAGATLVGPAIVVEANGTTVIETGWTGRTNASGILILERCVSNGRSGTAGGPGRIAAGDPAPVSDRGGIACDPVLLEIFNRRFMHVAEQMGAILEQTAESVNIRERLDYSCALFDATGALVANAPHVPVHLGSMSDSVRAVLERFPNMRAGDSFVMNAPYSGGTHLPDVTVVTPLFLERGAGPAFIVASRAHHADIGGKSPGSMPATSTTIAEEGIVLEPAHIVADSRMLETEIRQRLTSGPWPARDPDRNVADFKAQLAANARGSRELIRLLDRYGLATVSAYTKHVQANAETCVRSAIACLADGRAEVELDGGERIVVAVAVDKAARRATIDFTGTSDQSGSNFNAPASIARAVVLYVFRALIEHNIPLNGGCLAPLAIVLPPGSLLDPRPPAAVVAGNVETSQCIADALLAALGAQAASQGTMNNFTFGDAKHQYYETIGGGSGAGPGFAGASAVHSHMTNSRLTDPEILEQRFPVRLVRFAIRTGSGGDGRWHGGDGIVRELEFLAPLKGSMLANRRRTRPFGLAGGNPGASGRNYLIRRQGEIVEYGATAELTFEPGDRFVIETPGGGGYGA